MVTFKSVKERQLRFIDPNDIAPSDRNPRGSEEFEAGSLASLTKSIRRHGILQPVIVTSRGRGRYRLVEGERRWTVAKQLGLDVIPAFVIGALNGRDETVAMYHLHHQREDWNAADDWRAIQQLRAADPTITASELADELGMSLSTVRNRMMVGDSHPTLIAAIEAGDLKFTDALRAAETADALVRTRRKVVEDLGGKHEVARMLAEKAGRRRGLAPELVELRSSLVSRAEVRDAVVKRYVKDPAWTKRDVYAAAAATSARAGSSPRTSSNGQTRGPQTDSKEHGPQASSSASGSGLASRVRSWRAELERATRDPASIRNRDEVKLELVALQDTIDDAQRRLLAADQTAIARR